MNLKETFAKPAVSAGVSALAFRQFFGPTTVLRVYGKDVSTTIAGAVIGAASCYITEVTTQLILPHITKDVRMRHYESLVLTLGLSGAIFVAIPRFLIEGAQNNTAAINQNLFLAGVLAEVVAQWTYESFFVGSSSLFG